MGQILSQPVIEKHTTEGGNNLFKYALSSMQGWRVSMEDAHTTVLNIKDIDEDKQQDDNAVAFFAVFDGHGGDKIALYSGDNLYKIINKNEDFQKGDYSTALRQSFLDADVQILNDDAVKTDQSGCTATTILIDQNKVVCANAGDSRTVLSVNGNAKPLSYDHKPTNAGEHQRICAAGGFVEVGRVNGNLALSRAIGDFDFKKSADLPAEEQIVTVLPDIIEHEITEDDEFVVLACDGIWDCLSSQQVVEVVRRGIVDGKDLTEITEGIIDICLAPNSHGSGIGCDNMSIIIVAILNGKTIEEWYKSIAEKGGPISASFEEVDEEIYGANGIDAQQQIKQAKQDAETEEEDAKQSFSIQQLLEQNVLTNQNGVFYLDSANLLSQLGVQQLSQTSENESGEAEHNGEGEGSAITEIEESEDDNKK